MRLKERVRQAVGKRNEQTKRKKNKGMER